MKTRALSLTLATLMIFQSTAWAQSSRTDGIGDQQIARAQQEMAIIRHDLERLSTALGESERALLEKKAQGRLANIASISTASMGLAMAALAATTSLSGGKVGPVMITVQAALSAVTGYINYRATKIAPSDSANKAVRKARQEILAARTYGNENAENMDALLQLDESLQVLESALDDYNQNRTVNRRFQVVGIVTQTAGVAVAVGIGLGALRIRSGFGQILMASGNIATIIHGLTPAKSDLVLEEIIQTRKAVNTALENL